MEPIEFKEQNTFLGAGDNPNTVGMPVAVSVNEPMSEGRLHTVSCWQLSQEEIQSIIETGKIWVSNMAWPPPPVCVMAENPFTVHGFEALRPE